MWLTNDRILVIKGIMMLPNIETSEQPSGSMFGDIPRSEDCSDERGTFMSDQNLFESYVFSCQAVILHVCRML